MGPSKYCATIKRAIFGFLDQDCFPIFETSLIEHFSKDQSFFGLYDFRNIDEEIRWYLWPGFAFFNKKHWVISEMNLLPGFACDCGGMMWPLLREKGLSNGSFASQSMSSFTYNLYKFNFQLLDDSWLHTIAASNWNKLEYQVYRKKQQIIGHLLSQYLTDDPDVPKKGVNASAFFQDKFRNIDRI